MLVVWPLLFLALYALGSMRAGDSLLLLDAGCLGLAGTRVVCEWVLLSQVLNEVAEFPL